MPKLTVTSPTTGETFTRRTERQYTVCRIEHIPPHPNPNPTYYPAGHPVVTGFRRATWHANRANAEHASPWSKRSTVFEYINV